MSSSCFSRAILAAIALFTTAACSNAASTSVGSVPFAERRATLGGLNVLHTFAGAILPACSTGASADGAFPDSLAADKTGNLYGTTQSGGPCGTGTVYRLSPAPSGSWSYDVVYTFGGGVNGSSPNGPLVFDGQGNAYGSAASGGAAGEGTVFELNAADSSVEASVDATHPLQFSRRRRRRDPVRRCHLRCERQPLWHDGNRR